MLTQQIAIDMAKTFVSECKQNGLVLNDAFIFGSVAKGLIRADSDIDVVLISEKFTDNIFENLKLFSKINIKYPQIEVHPYSLKNYQKQNDFVKEISKDKIGLN